LPVRLVAVIEGQRGHGDTHAGQDQRQDQIHGWTVRTPAAGERGPNGPDWEDAAGGVSPVRLTGIRPCGLHPLARAVAAPGSTHQLCRRRRPDLRPGVREVVLQTGTSPRVSPVPLTEIPVPRYNYDMVGVS
jgi:hypothetical protein